MYFFNVLNEIQKGANALTSGGSFFAFKKFKAKEEGESHTYEPKNKQLLVSKET